MAIRPLEKTTCYKCEKPIEAIKSEVHPLCDSCEDDFMDWFNNQLDIFR